jgi:hypothetical protein
MTPPILRLSWSALKTHEECRQKAFLVREGKSNQAKNLRSYYHGMVVDRIMRQWLADPQPGAMPGMVDEAIDTGIAEARESGDGVVRWKHSEDRNEVRGYCKELVTRLEPILEKLVLPYPFQSALRFTYPTYMPYLGNGTAAEVHLVGEMDLLVRTPSGFVVLDLKGTADDQYWRRCIGQLVFYDLAVLANSKEPTAHVGLIQPMCTNPLVTFVVDQDMRRDLWVRLMRMARQMWSGDRDCKETTSGCQWCEVRHACVRYAPDADALGFGPTLAAGLRAAGLRAAATSEEKA